MTRTRVAAVGCCGVVLLCVSASVLAAPASNTRATCAVNTRTGPTEPAWSPDGQAIAVTLSQTASVGVWRFSTRKLRALAAFGSDPSWSPDSTRLVYTAGGVFSHRQGLCGLTDTDIFVRDARGRLKASSATESRSEFQPSWSPDGQKIAFTFYDANGEAGVGTFDVDTHAEQTIIGQAPGRSSFGSPSWSPDGREITFTINGYIIAVMRSDGSHVHVIRRANRVGSDLSWSPDGRKIAFSVNAHGRWTRSGGIFVMDADGSSPRRLTTGNDVDPTWSPDGRRIAFTRTAPPRGIPVRTFLLVVGLRGGHLGRLL